MTEQSNDHAEETEEPRVTRVFLRGGGQFDITGNVGVKHRKGSNEITGLSWETDARLRPMYVNLGDVIAVVSLPESG